jgi:hypothetical protein
MTRFVRGLIGAVVVGGAALGAAAPPARAQFQFVPPSNAQVGYDQAVLRNQVLSNAPFVPAPYFGFGGYGLGYGFYPGPAGGYLMGVADVIGAQGQYFGQIQSARLQDQQVQAAQIANRKAMFDLRRYELANTPSLQDLLDQERARAQREARSGASLPAILSGAALNELLKHSQQVQARGVFGPSIPLDRYVLQQIRVTGSQGAVGGGLLAAGGQLDWPMPLEDRPYQEDRQRLDELLAQAVQEVRSGGRVQNATLRDLIRTRDGLEARVERDVALMSPTDYVVSMRFLRQLRDTIRTLQDPNIAKVIGGQWVARGDSVAELVAHMTSNGLLFAPAGPADEPAYRALYNALAAYDTAMFELAKR